MQQLQFTALQQLQAWQQQGMQTRKQVPHIRHSLKLAAANHNLPCSLGLSRSVSSSSSSSSSTNASNPSRRHINRSACRAISGDSNSKSGDVVRPSAQAAAPPAPALDVSSSTPGSSNSGNNSSSSGSGSTAGGGLNGARLYSELYRTLHANPYSAAAQVNSSSSGGDGSKTNSSNNISNLPSLNGDSSLDHNFPPLPAADTSNGHKAPASHAASAAGGSPVAGVEDAIRKAQEALAAAESSLSSIHQLQSAQPPNKWQGLVVILKSMATVWGAGALLVASHAFGLGWQWAGATLGAMALAARAYQRAAVTAAGAAAVAAACLATLGCSMRFGLVMLAFSYSSAKLRKFREARQSVGYNAFNREESATARDWPEVCCIAGAPTILAVAYGAMAGCLDLPLGAVPAVETWRADLLTLLQGAVLGWYACCCGDAWSSELGSLSNDQPRLLTTLQPVRKGTHGAVTLLGLSGAAAGGLLVGLVFYCAAVLSPTLWVFETQRQAAMAQWRLIPLGIIAGLAGSLLDSLLGAALQFTGYDRSTETLSSSPGPSVSRISGLQQTWLGNDLVNFLSASLTAALTALAALRMFA